MGASAPERQWSGASKGGLKSYINFNLEFDAKFLCDSKILITKFMRFYFGAENMSSYYELYLYYLQTQLAGMILAPH